MLEKRKYPRISVRIPLQITLSDGSRVGVHTKDLSLAGLSLVYKYPAEVGRTLGLIFTVAARGERHEIRVRGRVAYSRLMASTDSYVIGMSFMDLSEEDRALLQRYILELELMRR